MRAFAESFSDLLFLERSELIDLLNRVENKTLLIALLNCETEVLSYTRSVLSVAGRAYLDDDIKRLKKACWSGSFLAQRVIIDILNGMIERNEISWPLTELCS